MITARFRTVLLRVNLTGHCDGMTLSSQLPTPPTLLTGVSFPPFHKNVLNVTFARRRSSD
jgi:hypothetical protein